MCAAEVTHEVFDDVERIACIVRTLNALKFNEKLIVSYFKKADLLSGYKDVSSHFAPSTFLVGTLLRGSRLSVINTSYVKHVSSLRNLAAGRGEPVVIPESLISEQYRQLSEYSFAANGFRKFHFYLGASVEPFTASKPPAINMRTHVSLLICKPQATPLHPPPQRCTPSEPARFCALDRTRARAIPTVPAALGPESRLWTLLSRATTLGTVLFIDST